MTGCNEGSVWRQAVLGAALLSAFGAADTVPARAGEGDAAAGGRLVLPSVKVEEGADGGGTATAPVAGYVAHRSAGATKSDTSLLETPQSVSVITRDQIDAQHAESLNEALRYTAGVTPETRGSIASRYDMFKVRGFDADTYWNGLKLQGNDWYILPQIDSYFMERVEVVKGSSSVLYGQAKAGGVVNQVGKAPTETAQNEVGLEFGSNAHMRGTVDLSGPVDSSGRVLYRIVGVGLSEDSQLNHTDSERVGVMPSLTLRPNDDTKVNLYALYQHDPSAGAYGTVPAKGSAVSAARGSIASDFYDGDPRYETFDRTQTALGYQAEHALAKPVTLRLNGRWFHTEQAYASVYGAGTVSDDGTLSRSFIRSNDKADTFAFDNQLEGKLATGPVRHTLLAGFDYQRLNTSYRVGYGTASSINVYAPTYGNALVDEGTLAKTSVTSDQIGAYLQDQLEWGGFTLTLSGREDWAQAKTLTTGAEQFDRAFTGRAGLTYLFDSGIAPYVSYAQSFVPQAGTDALTGKALEPEQGEQYELGIKYQPNGVNALFTAAVFELTRSNLMTYVSGIGNVQSGKAQSRGLELEGKAEITPDLSLIASYTYLDTKYLKDESGLTGKRLVGIPRNSASVWGDYTLSSGPLRGLGLGAGVRFFDDSTNTANTFGIDGVTLVDAALRYDLKEVANRLDGATLYLNAKNLFDTKYVTCFWGDASGDSNWCSYGYGRTVLGGLRYRW